MRNRLGIQSARIHAARLRRIPLAAYVRTGILVALSCLLWGQDASATPFRVPGNSGTHWLDTGLDVAPNTQIRLTASGRVDIGGTSYGPEGTRVFATGPGWPAEIAFSYGLVARLTSNRTNPNDDLREDWAYGASANYCARQGGHLWLTVNDNQPADNSGVFNVDVQLVRGCAPLSYQPSPSGGDLAVTGIEVTQAIQTYAPGNPARSNQIPLVGYKRTAVRVYLRADAGGGGVWSDVTGRLNVRSLRAGSTLHDRFLLPVNGLYGVITANPAGSTRNRLDDSLLFLLDNDQTEPGELELRPEVFSLSRRAEANAANNTQTLRVTFGPARTMEIFGAVFGNQTDPMSPPAPWSDFELHRRFVLAMYPISDFFILPIPGIGAMAPPQSPFLNLEAARAWRNRLYGTLPALAPIEDHARVYMLQNWDTRLGGLTTGAGACDGQNNRGARGWVMAHELGHSWGFEHVHDTDCDDYPAWEPYPHAHCTIGPQTGVNLAAGPTLTGFELKQSSSSSSPAHDIMSYSGDQWISPYTYCKLLDTMSDGRVRCPTGVQSASVIDQLLHARFAGMGVSRAPLADTMPSLPLRSSIAGGFVRRDEFMRVASAGDSAFRMRQSAGQPSGGGGAAIYVAGLLKSDGSARFEPFEIITDAKNLPPHRQGSAFHIVLEARTGGVLVDYPFAPEAWDAKPREPIMFSEFVPWREGTGRILLVRNGKTLAERKVTPTVPQVELLAPTCSEILSGKRTIAWRASDADGDALIYSLDYSTDAGRSWTPMNVLLRQNSVTVDFNTLPGSEQAMLRVRASDGVNTGEARTKALCRIPRKGPQVALSAQGGSEVGPGKPVTLSATAFDWEDGPIARRDAFRWTSDRDGVLGDGSWLVLSNAKLSPGPHWIKLSVVDSDRNVASASLRITVQRPPTEFVPTPRSSKEERDRNDAQAPPPPPAPDFYPSDKGKVDQSQPPPPVEPAAPDQGKDDKEQQTDQNPNWTHAVPGQPSQDGDIEYGTNRIGGDFTGSALAGGPQECRMRCAQDARCLAWTYVQPGIQGPAAMCWLKSVVPPPAKDQCCASGVKQK